MKVYLGIVLIISLLLTACGPTTYQVGTATVSIEPDDRTPSLTLGGYAAPYEGRFSLTWTDKGATQAMVYTTSLGADIYGLQANGQVVVFDPISPASVVKTIDIAKGKSVKCLTGFGNSLYGIEATTLMCCKPASDKPEWTKVGDVEPAAAMAASSENLYVATASGALLMGTLAGGSIAWQTIGKHSGIIGMTCDSRMLYALTNNNIIWQRPLKRKNADWIRCGVKNDATYTIDVKQITFAGSKLYALASDGHWYESRHSSEGNLSARAVSISKGKNVAVIVSIDVVGVDHSFVESIRNEIKQKRGIPPQCILINATHTHYAPVTQAWLTWEPQNQLPDSLYLNEVVRVGIIKAINESLDNTWPAHLSYGSSTTDIGINRSLKGDEAIYDNRVDVVKAESIDGKQKLIIFEAACHPVFPDPIAGHFTLTANYPGVARNILQKEQGLVNAVFLQGCCGDINPKDPFTESGKRLAAAVEKALDSMTCITGSLSAHIDSLPIKAGWEKEKITSFTDTYGASPRNIRWKDLNMKKYPNGSQDCVMPVFVHTLNIGNWKIVGISREVTTEYALSVKNLWPDKPVTVLGYTDDVSSYLSADSHVKAGTYEGFDSFFWYGQPSPYPMGTLQNVTEAIKKSNR